MIDQPEGPLLDIGCGTGEFLADAARSRKSFTHLIGIDLSEKMATIARKKLAPLWPSERSMVVQGDFSSLPVKTGTIDYVYAGFSLEILPEKVVDEALDEIGRVLRPNGKVVVVSMYQGEKESVPVSLYKALSNIAPRMIDCKFVRAGQWFSDRGYNTLDLSVVSMWGLPVQIYKGKKGQARKDNI